VIESAPLASDFRFNDSQPPPVPDFTGAIASYGRGVINFLRLRHRAVRQ